MASSCSSSCNRYDEDDQVKSSEDQTVKHDPSLKEEIIKSDDTNKKKEYFGEVYVSWLKIRKETLKKLKTLLESLHSDQLGYNKMQIACRKTGCFSRQMKSNVQSRPLDILASVVAVFSDASSSLVSVAQAVSIETYQTQFHDIMIQDEKITKQLYQARSECLDEYCGIEEVFRKFQANTFGSAVTKVSNALEMDSFLVDFDQAFQTDDMNQVLRVAQRLIEKGSQSNVAQDVNDSIHSYLYSNPAALDAFKSVGRAVYEVLDASGFRQNQSVSGSPNNASNSSLIGQYETEILQLQRTVEGNMSQSKFEEKLQDALDTLTSEMVEINAACLNYI